MSNRTTVKTNIVAQNVPTVSNAYLTAMLNTELADNLVFREDVVGTQSSSVSAITCDFTGKDRINLTRTGGSLLITLTGLSDGEHKYLYVTKTAGQTITFSSATDVTPLTSNLTAASTILFEVWKKQIAYPFVRAIYNTITVASEAEVLAAVENAKILTPASLAFKAATDAETLTGTDTTHFITPANLQAKDGGLITKILTFTGWNMDTTDTKAVAHGLAAGLWDNIADVKAVILNNSGSALYSLEGVGIGGELGGMIIIDSVNVSLYRTTGGRFDSASFNAATGMIVIRYALS